MQMVKIRIPAHADRVKSLPKMVERGRVICLPDEVFIVPEPALALLSSLEVDYQELGRGGLGYAEKALRDATTAQAQRRPTRKRPPVEIASSSSH